MSSVKRATITALCIALCAVLPLAFHAVGLGGAFSPMHLPVLLCGLVCGPGYGLFCGVAGPVISSLTTSMPSAVQLIHFVPELAVYGLLSGLLYQKIRTGRRMADLYLSLAAAMAAGRIVGGCAQALFYFSSSREYSPALWVSAYFIGTAPGIALQLILLPLLVTALEQTNLIPKRYGRTDHEK